ncbi:hypothetical protein SEPCBS57363_003455 [Sporothrix epigloea]|uniref:RRM domain-containing protein n=1 Tax=Sporothrix epigloea TaxID=1892477 RepID=A0ABP0DLL9_9PEZI
MDFDIEMEDAAGQYRDEIPQEVAPQDDILTADAENARKMGEAGEIDETVETSAAATENTTSDLALTKIHIRGLDALNADDITAYVSEHFTGDGGRKGPFDRIEWIDDTSANLVFTTEAAAASALAALSSVAIDDVAQLQVGRLLPAKTYSAKSDDVSAGLSVRFALASDKKEAGAATRSRFYLLHPEYDPEERKRNHQNRRQNGREGGHRDSRHSRHRSYRNDRHDHLDRQIDILNNYFDENLYDDDRPAQSESSLSRQSRSNHQPRRRPRSRSTSRDRSYSPKLQSNNRGKELFPVDSGTQSKELFPDNMLASSITRGHNRNGRSYEINRLRDRSASPRRGEVDFFYDAAGADLYDEQPANNQAEPVSAAAAHDRSTARAERDLLSTTGSKVQLELFPDDAKGTAQMDLLEVSLKHRLTRPIDKLNIRGSAGSGNKQGISIKGASSARELFPDKLHSNSDQDRKGGRGFSGNSLSSRIQRPRQRAEDLFH